MKWAIAFSAAAALMLAGCQRPMTWREMHEWMPRDEYRALHAVPLPPSPRIQAPVETRDC